MPLSVGDSVVAQGINHIHVIKIARTDTTGAVKNNFLNLFDARRKITVALRQVAVIPRGLLVHD